jgi:hypothetical protein
MSSRTFPTSPDDPGDDFASDIAELEAYANHSAAPAPPADRAPAQAEQPTPVRAPDGRTRAVRRLENRVAEAHHLVTLQSDDAPLFVESARVRRRRLAVIEAATLHRMSQDPAASAWQTARWRRGLSLLGTLALLTALTWSAVGVHTTAAAGARPWSAAWSVAWLVEPCISAVVLLIVGARAFLAARGRPLHSDTLNRVEYVALGGTLTLNTWPYLPVVSHDFSTVRLMVHMVGPLVAVAAVISLTIIWSALAALPLDEPAQARTARTYSTNTPALATLVERARQLITAGTLPAAPSAHRVRAALGCGMDTARAIRDALSADAA